MTRIFILLIFWIYW